MAPEAAKTRRMGPKAASLGRGREPLNFTEPPISNVQRSIRPVEGLLCADFYLLQLLPRP